MPASAEGPAPAAGGRGGSEGSGLPADFRFAGSARTEAVSGEAGAGEAPAAVAGRGSPHGGSLQGGPAAAAAGAQAQPDAPGTPAGVPQPSDGAAEPAWAADAPWLDAALDRLVAGARVLDPGGRTHLILDLHPAHLGRLRMRVALEGQVVSAEFIAASPEVRETIAAHLGDLRSALSERGLEAGSLDVWTGTAGARGGFAGGPGGTPHGGFSTGADPAAGSGGYPGRPHGAADRAGYAAVRGWGRQLDVVA